MSVDTSGFSLILGIIAGAFIGFSMAPDTITPARFKYAENVCVENGGLKFVEMNFTGILIKCQNSAEFEPTYHKLADSE